MLVYSVIISLFVTLALLFLSIKFPITLSNPTRRGLHDQSKPSSGGVALLGAYISLSILAYFGHHNVISISSPIVPLSLISVLGLLDDKYQLSKMIRFIAQGVISLLIITSMDMSILELIIWTFFFLFFINIYNFMDGIDGIAASQAIYIFIAFMILENFYSFNELILFMIPLIVFLFFNISPSKIFLGNAGSYLIGMLISILIFKSTLLFNNENYISHIFSILILLTIFIGDASYTLLSRFFYKFKLSKNILVSLKHITTPHNLHNYQILAKKYHNHNKVNLYLMLYNILWCFPLAYLSQIFSNFALLFIIFSYVPYLIYCYKNNTGKD